MNFENLITQKEGSSDTDAQPLLFGFLFLRYWHYVCSLCHLHEMWLPHWRCTCPVSCQLVPHNLSFYHQTHISFLCHTLREIAVTDPCTSETLAVSATPSQQCFLAVLIHHLLCMVTSRTACESVLHPVTGNFEFCLIITCLPGGFIANLYENDAQM
jgi:hypothetical protein